MAMLTAVELRVTTKAARHNKQVNTIEKATIWERRHPISSIRIAKWSLDPKNGDEPRKIRIAKTNNVSKMGRQRIISGAKTPHSVSRPYDVPKANALQTNPKKRLPLSPMNKRIDFERL